MHVRAGGRFTVKTTSVPRSAIAYDVPGAVGLFLEVLSGNSVQSFIHWRHWLYRFGRHR